MRLKERLKKLPKINIEGRILSIKGNIIEAVLPIETAISDMFITPNGAIAEVIGFKENRAILMSYQDLSDIKIGSFLKKLYKSATVGVGEELLGTVLDPFGNPLNKERIVYSNYYYLKNDYINPLKRGRIKDVFDTGIRAINALFTIGKGQKIGILSGAGVGKSTLLGMIARFSNADVNVIALIGERGREVREFIEDNLSEEGLKKSVVITATSDMPALTKLRAIYSAIAIAKYFSNKGKDVLFLVDSLTRIAMAQREIGLSAGEPPTSKGYTPSVFTLLPKITEQAGVFEGKGSITGIFTVLIEGDDISLDPVADAAVSFLDGHIVLSREQANKRIYPAIDILKSISRLMPQLLSQEYIDYASKIIYLYSKYKEAEDMINLGLYKEGNSKEIDLAIELAPYIEEFIKQGIDEKIDFKKSLDDLKKLALLTKKV